MADYKKYEQPKKKRAPIIISNHLSFMDMFLFLTLKKAPSYLAMAPTKKAPIIGWIADHIQCIFVDRRTEEGRARAIKDMEERIENIMSGKNFPSFLVFPEGTCNNGTDMMSFKSGAFSHEVPMKIYGIQFEGNVSPCWNLDGGAGTMFLLFSN